MIRVKKCVIGMVLAAVSMSATATYADDFPSRPVRIVMGFAAGASTDPPARLLAERFAEELGQAFVLENRPGAGGNLAAEYVARSAKDGYTLLWATNSLATASAVDTGYSTVDNFAPIIKVVVSPQMLVAHPSLGADNLAQLIALAKERPGKITYGGSGGLAMTGLSGVLLNNMADIKLLHIPYTGSARSVADLLAGNIDLVFAPTLAVMPYVESGRLKAIATTSAERSKLAPNVPTMAESGLPGYDLTLWNVLVAPAGTPRAIIDKLSSVANNALKSDDVIKRINSWGFELGGGTPEDLAQFLAQEVTKMKKLAVLAGLKK